MLELVKLQTPTSIRKESKDICQSNVSKHFKNEWKHFIIALIQFLSLQGQLELSANLRGVQGYQSVFEKRTVPISNERTKSFTA